MNIKFRRQFAMVAIAAAMFCTACGTSPRETEATLQEPLPAGGYFLGQVPVYAYLDSGSAGSWIFTTITESDLQPSSGYLVRLNDLAPAFDTRLAECTPQVYPSNHKCSLTHPFRKKEVGVIGRIISGGITAGTAGKVNDISRNYKTSFDDAVFNQAVDEALVNMGLDSERQQFIATLEDYASMLADAEQELDALARQANDSYRNTSAIPITVQPTVSGLTAYYTNDIDFRSLIEIVPRPDSSTVPASLDSKPLLPCDARNCATTARHALASLQAEVANAKSAIPTADSEETATYDIRCGATTQNGYLFTLECPEQLRRDSSGGLLVPLTVAILSRDFEALYPDFVLADEQLDVSIAGSTVNFRNLTSDYLSVNAQSVYYNSQVQTSSLSIDLAPGVAVSRPISEFVSPAIGIESSFRQMTPDKAAAASFRFGFATKYRVTGHAEYFTLYDMRTFNVGCTIDNRIEFGSCTEAETVEVDEQQQIMPEPDDSDANAQDTVTDAGISLR